MDKKIFILFFCLALICGLSHKSFSCPKTNTPQQSIKDTTIHNEAKEDKVIEEVVETKAAPKKEKIQYISQVTKHGFKDLFSHYSYNPGLSYSAQINPNAEGFIQDYMTAHSGYLLKMKGWAQPYFMLIESVLQQYGLPKELKYIAVIESNLQSGAVSGRGATGPWQLMPETATQLGLTVNSYTDERTDYYKSTRAASKLLLQLYAQLHDWLLVMAAYNGGMGMVQDAIRKSGTRDFWQLQYYLPEESRTYVKRFIATHYIMEGNGSIAMADSTLINNGTDLSMDDNEQTNFTNYGTSGGIDPHSRKPKLTDTETADVKESTITGRYNSLVIAKNLSMEIEQFNRYNPSFDNVLKSTGSFDLRLPSDKMQLFIVNKYAILNECVQILLGDASVPNNRTVYRHASCVYKTNKKYTAKKYTRKKVYKYQF